MSVSLSIHFTNDLPSLLAVENLVTVLRIAATPPPNDQDQPPETLADAPPDAPPPPPQLPAATAAPQPEDFVEAWLGHLGPGSRSFWRMAAERAARGVFINFEDLARANDVLATTLRSYHRNSYRAIKDENAPDPMPGVWDGRTRCTVYSMSRAVAAKILELTADDPE